MYAKILKWAIRLAFWLIMIALIMTFIRDSTLPLGDPWTAIGVIARNHQFDYIGWEVNALAVKTGESIYGVAPYMTEPAQADFVRAYMRDLQTAQQLEGEVSAIYADPNVSDPESASVDQRARRDALRADLDSRQPLAESILERQVTRVLRDLGFAVAGVIVPPVSMHFTRVPNLLVVSPRDQIRFDVSINLDPMPVDEIAALEDQIDTDQDVSSLIVPLGGIALYPAMILETTSIPFALETFAHEWLHHYLMFHPLGLQYFTNGEGSDGEARILNETTADTFGKEVARLVLARYYPDLVPPPAPPPVPVETPSETEPLAFDFGREMHITRTHVDELLAAGKIDESEAYMEERRQFFIANGYGVRRINQAFFAFYGGYQGGGMPGVGGEDPIGPAIRALRLSSPTLKDFVITMQDLTTRADLLAAAARVGGISDPTSP